MLLSFLPLPQTLVLALQAKPGLKLHVFEKLYFSIPPRNEYNENTYSDPINGLRQVIRASVKHVQFIFMLLRYHLVL